MTDIEFNEFGLVPGTKSIGILDSSGLVIDTTVVKEDETEENMLLFAQQTEGFDSYFVMTDPSITVGYKLEGETWIPPQPKPVEGIIQKPIEE